MNCRPPGRPSFAVYQLLNSFPRSRLLQKAVQRVGAKIATPIGRQHLKCVEPPICDFASKAMQGVVGLPWPLGVETLLGPGQLKQLIQSILHELGHALGQIRFVFEEPHLQIESDASAGRHFLEEFVRRCTISLRSELLGQP